MKGDKMMQRDKTRMVWISAGELDLLLPFLLVLFFKIKFMEVTLVHRIIFLKLSKTPLFILAFLSSSMH